MAFDAIVRVVEAEGALQPEPAILAPVQAHADGVHALVQPLHVGRGAGVAAEDFRAFADAHPRFRYVPCLSRELPAPGSAHAHPDVRHGYVQQQLAGFAPDPATDIAYLCGNPDMVDACFEALKAAGLPVPQIRREKYVSSK